MGDLSNRINEFVTKEIQFGVDKYQCPFCDQMHSKDQPEFQAHWPNEKEQQILMDRANKPPVNKAWDKQKRCSDPKCSWQQGYGSKFDRMNIGAITQCPRCGKPAEDRPLKLPVQMHRPDFA